MRSNQLLYIKWHCAAFGQLAPHSETKFTHIGVVCVGVIPHDRNLIFRRRRWWHERVSDWIRW